jgi:glycosyltransferase involved in cell wall biosynthesis
VVLENLSRNLPEDYRVVAITGGIGSRREGGSEGEIGEAVGGEGSPSAAQSRGPRSRVVRLDARADLLLLGTLSRLQSLLPGATKHFYRSYRDRYYATRAAAVCAREGASCIAFASCPQWAPTLRRENPKAKLVLFKRTDWLSAAPAGFERYLDFVNALICPYDSLAERICARFPSLSERVHVVPDGVDTQLFRPQKVRARHRILYVGRLSPERGVHVLVDAFQLLKDRYPDADLVIVGREERSPRETLLGTSFGRVNLPGQGRYGYSRMLHRASRGVGDFFLAGQVPYERLPGFYASSSVLVLPTLTDTAVGLTLAEAMACGLPVVASRNGPASEVVQDGRTGLLVEPGDLNQLIGAVERIFDSRETAAKMAEASRAQALKNFDWKEITERCLDALGMPVTRPEPS